MVSKKIKALLALAGKRQVDLADYFNMTSQSMNNKMNRNSWSAKDLVKAAEFTNCKLAFILPDGQHIVIENDISEDI